MTALRAQKLLVVTALFVAIPQPLMAAAEMDPQQYNNRWAVVVGVNYESTAIGELPKLKFAEDDAKKFHERLVSNYGFSTQNASLLLGANATREAIDRKLDDIYDQAEDDDCVIFYFSGHGYNRQPTAQDAKEQMQLEVLPSDVQFRGATPTGVKILKMKSVIDDLSNRCKARHKLLILDCCYSGAVFSGGRGAAVFDASRVDESVFRLRGFQAMTASREEQKARDGKFGDGHSPFTEALLRALETIPAMQKKAKAYKPFTTTELFSGMQWFLDQKLGPGQSPRCSWLDGGQGELHFFPEGEFPDPDVPDDQNRKVMLAMVPGSFGNWWFEETPWFMPGLRYELVATDEEERGLDLEMISSLRLERAANEIRNKYFKSPGSEIPDRVRHLDKLLNAKGDKWDAAVKDVMNDLKVKVDPHFVPGEKNAEPTVVRAANAKDLAQEQDVAPANADKRIAAANGGATAADINKQLDQKTEVAGSDTPAMSERKKLDTDVIERAMDLHYLAVLRQASRGAYLERARTNYDDALSLYKEAAEHSQQYKPLLALCKADRGWYSMNIDRNYEEAFQSFAEARSIYGSLTPKPFQIYVLCREAEALSKLGRVRAAKQRLEEAQAAAKEVDPAQAFPLTASLYRAKAWLEMNWCEFPAAIGDFAASTSILSKPANDSHEARILCLHNTHGIAMAHRYSGESSKAVEMYRSLLKDEIYKQVRAMRESVGRETNYKQMKSRWTERWVNTLERCGDCSLFGEPKDVAEASDDYRRALRAANHLPVEIAPTWERKMRLKWALTLALPKSGVQDPELAREQLNEADRITAKLPETAKPLEPNYEISARLTRLILAYCDLPQSAAADGAVTAAGDADVARQLNQVGSISRGDVLAPEPNASVPALGSTEGNSCDDKPFDEQLKCLRRYLTDLAKTSFLDSKLSRDDIEIAMFSMRVILEDFPDPSLAVRGGRKDRITRRKDIELLLDFCRLGRQGNIEALHFVRPYYDCAISALVKLEPKDTKQLVEVSWEAMTGKAHFKPHGHGATLVFYCGGDSNYFFLDVPRGPSAIYPLQGIDFERIMAASHGEKGPVEQLALPMQLRKELLAVDGEICLCWRDHVKELGVSHVHEHNVAKVIIPETVGLPLPVALATVRTDKLESADYRFPFTLPESVHFVDGWPVEKEAPVVKEAAPNASEPLSSNQGQSLKQESVPQ